jgi:hypothetical protein
MTAQDWQGLLIASNEGAMQWYSLVTQKPLPVAPDIMMTPPTRDRPGGFGISTQGILLIGGLLVIAFVLFRK